MVIPMNKTFSILSAICMGVAVAPLVSIVWFMVPFLSQLRIGHFPLYFAASPLGFGLGLWLGFFLNQCKNGGNARIIIGLLLFFGLLALVIMIYIGMQKAEGWDEVGWVIAMVAALSLVTSAVSFIFSGLFAHLGHKSAKAKAAIR